jgi:opacity protein-like surface antigen
MPIKATRSPHNPVIHPGSDEAILGNINGPSLIRVPDWVENPLGNYYLYFAHHQGKFIRMAYADDVMGPYTVHTPGVLRIGDTLFERHIASPDVHVDDENHVIRMFYHGAGFTGSKHENLNQNACHAESADGVTFTCDRVCIGPAYMRVWEWDGITYGFGGGGSRDLWRTTDFRKPFDRGPALEIEGEAYTDPSRVQEVKQNPDDLLNRLRHTGLDLRGHELDIYYSSVGDHPERIRRTTVDIRPDWTEWCGSQATEILRTEMDYEGASEPDEPSTGGASHEPVHQVRDPFLYTESDQKYLVYSIAGEKGLAIAEITSQ